MVPAERRRNPRPAGGLGGGGGALAGRDLRPLAEPPAGRAAARRPRRRSRAGGAARGDGGGARSRRRPTRRRRNGSARSRPRPTTACVAARNAFVSMPHRPSGAGGRTAAFGRLVDDLDWFDALAREQPAPGSRSAAASPPSAPRSKPRSRPPCARAAERLRANDPGDGGDELRGAARGPRGRSAAPSSPRLARSTGLEDDAARVTAELNEAYRLRGLAFAALQIGRHAVQVERRPGAARADPDARPQRPARRAGGSPTRTRSMSSVWLRNSVRGAAGLALAVLVAKVTDAQNGFWVVLGTISVLRSSALATGTTVVEAITGTAIGIVVGGLHRARDRHPYLAALDGASRSRSCSAPTRRGRSPSPPARPASRS